MTTTEKRLEIVLPKKVNVIWFLADQLRAQALSYQGDPNVRTPNLDNMARWGKNFQSAVSGSPWCTPFRGALLTGLYPHQSEVTMTPSKLDPSIPTITKPFKEAGYHTAWVGKWHLDGSNSQFHYVEPDRRGGFDYWMGYENNNNHNETYVYGTNQETPRRLPGYETDGLTDLLIEHLREHVNKQNTEQGYQPFFAALSVIAPHDPYVAPTTDDHRYFHNPANIQLRPNVPHVQWVREKAALDLAGYSGMVENLDMNVGKLRTALKDMSIDRDTYLIFFSDHGDCLGSHAQWGKSSPWEEAVRIPFLIAKENGVTPMKKGPTDVVMNHVDIAPTTLGICGIRLPADMQGFDYSSLCVSSKNGQAGADIEASIPDSAYLQQIPRKYHKHSVDRPWRGVVFRDGWKYVCMPNHSWLLFDTKNDPYEMANLCYDQAFLAQRRRCHERLARWIEETGDQFDLPSLD